MGGRRAGDGRLQWRANGPDRDRRDLPEADSVKAGVGFVESEYRIAPQDTLEINVYQFQNLSRVAQVDGSGRVSLPLIGSVVAAGRRSRISRPSSRAGSAPNTSSRRKSRCW